MVDEGKDRDLPYILQERAGARRVMLRILPDCGLVVTVPTGYDKTKLDQLLEGKRRWIERHLGERSQATTASSLEDLLPKSIAFAANGEAWQVRYNESPRQSLKLSSDFATRLIELEGDISDFDHCRRLLKRWLRDQGKRILLPWLARLSAESGLRADRIQIRTQRDRWGSYSVRGVLSLNAAMLFLTPPEARYVMLHELCHTVHHGHPLPFWELVRRLEPDYRRLNAATEKAEGKVPAWVRL